MKHMLLNDKFFEMNHKTFEVTEKNIYYAKLLSQDYGSTESELTTLMQYLYGSLKLSEPYPEVANCLYEIACCELKHLLILGDMIEQLGGDPKYCAWYADLEHDWSPKEVIYETTLVGILNENIKMEINSINSYHRHMELIDDDKILNLLERIVSEEENHLKILMELYHEYIIKIKN